MSDPSTHTDGPAADCADEPPIPPRYWWTKRIGITVGVFLALMIAARLWWGWYAHRQLQAAIDKIIAAGEPIYPQDFDPPEPIPDDQNAAPLLIQAAETLTVPSAQNPQDSDVIEGALQDPSSLGRRMDEAGILIESNAKVLELVHEAHLRRGVDWGVRTRSPITGLEGSPWLNSRASLSGFCSVAASYYHRRGDNSMAVRILRDMLGHARAIDLGSGRFSHSSANSVYARAAIGVEETAPCLRIRPDTPLTMNNTSVVSRKEILELVDELLNERHAREGFLRLMRFERMLDLYTVQEVVKRPSLLRDLWQTGDTWWERLSGRYPLGSSAWWESVSLEHPVVLLIRPAYELYAVVILEWTTKQVQAARCPNWPAAARSAAGELTQLAGWKQMTRPMGWMTGEIMATWDKRLIYNHFRAIALRRMAATALAIRLYEVDRGHRPAALAELVPEYLPGVPLDPFTDDERTIRYVPDAWPPVLYSVGEDGMDDRGAYAIESLAYWFHVEPDLPFFLDGYRSDGRESEQKRPKSPECLEHNRDEEDARRNGGEDQ